MPFAPWTGRAQSVPRALLGAGGRVRLQVLLILPGAVSHEACADVRPSRPRGGAAGALAPRAGGLRVGRLRLRRRLRPAVLPAALGRRHGRAERRAFRGSERGSVRRADRRGGLRPAPGHADNRADSRADSRADGCAHGCGERWSRRRRGRRAGRSGRGPGRRLRRPGRRRPERRAGSAGPAGLTGGSSPDRAVPSSGGGAGPCLHRAVSSPGGLFTGRRTRGTGAPPGTSARGACRAGQCAEIVPEPGPATDMRLRRRAKAGRAQGGALPVPSAGTGCSPVPSAGSGAPAPAGRPVLSPASGGGRC